MEHKSKNTKEHKTKGFIPSYLIEFILTIAICFVAYVFGYFGGSLDGYTEGYINGRTGVYAEMPSFKIQRNLFGDLAIMGRDLIDFCENQYESLISKNEENKSICIQTEKNISNRVSNSLDISLSEIPEAILNQFINDDWNILIIDKKLEFSYRGNANYKANGSTNYSKKLISLKGTVNNIREITSHEFGHYFDLICNKISQSNEWNSTYLKEWKNFYCIDREFQHIESECEYFAEVFSWYILKHGKLKKNCPESYAFMDNLISNFPSQNA